MKKIKFVLLVLAFGLILIACKHQAKGDHTKNMMESKEMTGIEYTSDFVCPMHCAESGSHEAGTCPVCGMDYVALNDHKEDGHHHDAKSHNDDDEHDHDENSDHNHN